MRRLLFFQLSIICRQLEQIPANSIDYRFEIAVYRFGYCSFVHCSITSSSSGQKACFRKPSNSIIAVLSLQTCFHFSASVGGWQSGHSPFFTHFSQTASSHSKHSVKQSLQQKFPQLLQPERLCSQKVSLQT